MMKAADYLLMKLQPFVYHHNLPKYCFQFFNLPFLIFCLIKKASITILKIIIILNEDTFISIVDFLK